MSTTNERIIGIRIPNVLYSHLANVARRHYKSISEVIRESIIEKMEDEFTIKEWAMIEKALAESYKEEGINWRKIKRDKI
jgi:Arc/MetJ-type ribon-helix-helix transcriptional regulator